MSIEFRDLGLGQRLVDYQEAWALQREVHDAVAAGTAPPTVLLLEHEAVYTAGKRTEAHERPVDGTPVIDVDRGGKITWHGPGQLVAYPIVKLPDSVLVVDYVRRCEEAMIRTLADFGITTGRVEGRSGVWLPAPDRKIAAIGIRVAAQTTMHGVAINVANALDAYRSIVPCGIPDADTTTMVQEAGRPISVVEVAAAFRPRLAEMLAFEPYDKSPDAHALVGAGHDAHEPAQA